MRRVLWIVLAAAIACTLAYLRDPPWLAHVESGFRSWETSPDGIRYRWTDGHASFFVPADATSLTMPIRTTFDAPEDPPVQVSLSIDDRAADELILRNPGWQVRRLRMPGPGRRRLRRIDVRIDRLRDGNRGVQLGEVQVRR